LQEQTNDDERPLADSIDKPSSNRPDDEKRGRPGEQAQAGGERSVTRPVQFVSFRAGERPAGLRSGLQPSAADLLFTLFAYLWVKTVGSLKIIG
jgi:hypothetical protein